MRSAFKLINQRILTKLQMEESLRQGLGRAIFYLLVIVWVLFTLRLLSVPLTIFTVVGGALAVGIGFGSQNLVNNFISGLLVMMERPLKVGDYIEIKGVEGFVERIGIRATEIKTGKNTQVIIPNKTFLEEFLTNYSHSAGLGKSFIRVGVAYGSDLKQVTELCLAAVSEDDAHRAYPEPGVYLLEFADNCLTMEIISWFDAPVVGDKYNYEARVRERIYNKFNAAGVSIPFPQRDIRVEMVQPRPQA